MALFGRFPLEICALIVLKNGLNLHARAIRVLCVKADGK